MTESSSFPRDLCVYVIPEVRVRRTDLVGRTTTMITNDDVNFDVMFFVHCAAQIKCNTVCKSVYGLASL